MDIVKKGSIVLMDLNPVGLTYVLMVHFAQRVVLTSHYALEGLIIQFLEVKMKKIVSLVQGALTVLNLV